MIDQYKESRDGVENKERLNVEERKRQCETERRERERERERERVKDRKKIERKRMYK